jgi:hypothetical protein
VWIFKKNGFFANIVSDAPCAIGDGGTNHRIAANMQLVTFVNHAAAGITVPGAQDSPFARFVHEEDAGVIETKFVADNIHRAVQ